MKTFCRFWKSFLAGAFLLVAGVISAQIYYFDNYSVSEGLAQSKVFTIIQDRNDYIWLAGYGRGRFTVRRSEFREFHL